MPSVRIAHQPVPRKRVRLCDSPIKDRQVRNGEYLLSLDVDRLVHNFRVNAGLPSNANPYGGWESPECGLRGHFVGHYLSACALMWSSTGETAFQRRAQEIVVVLHQCQRQLHGGYLSAFPMTEFDVLEKLFGGVWAPYYTLHKLLAGLIDVYRETESDDSLEVAKSLGGWICKRIARLDDSVLKPMLRTDKLNPSNEYGGIGESLYDLFEITSDDEYLRTAKVFDRSWFVDPLAKWQDELAGLHSNTHIPQMIAAAKRYRLTGEEKYKRAAEYFWDRTAQCRTYVNGGSSGPRPDRAERSEGGEHWPLAGHLKGTLTPKINESCVVHNMIRLTDQLMELVGKPEYAEFRERAWFNDVLGMQHPNQPGAYIYSHPLCGCRKIYGGPEDAFWCCYGTTVEAYARLSDGIYSTHGVDCVVNQFVASTVEFPDKGLTIEQRTQFPYEPGTSLCFRCRSSVQFTLRIRQPAWCRAQSLILNGKVINGTLEDGYVTVSRRWEPDDCLQIELPMRLRAETLSGDPNMVAFLYGPVVLAAKTPHAGELGCISDEVLHQLQTVDRANLHFSLRLVFGGLVPLVPLHEIVDEPFSVYFRTRSAG